ncbi:MAG: response regulator transcription factor [Elusimicrobia bacterium]|nr:response regulator transcription factor [Elusimicrobiota bacterium]
MIIAIVGQDSRFCMELQDVLQAQGHRVSLMPDCAKAAARLASEPPHLIVLDGLPSKEAAVDLLRTLRSNQSTRVLPILQVDPAGTMKDVVAILDAGADDYLAKPFNHDIFLARVRTLLRRSLWNGTLPAEPVTAVTGGMVKVGLVDRTVNVGGAEVSLTRLEFDLLAFLVKNKDRVLKRVEILEAVWKYPQEVETRTLDKHVETLRRKLGEAGRCVRTIHGVGYRFTEDAPVPASE